MTGLMLRLVLLLAMLGGTGFAQKPGQQLYESNCAGCHGLDARGGEHAPDIATAQRVRQRSHGELIRIVRDGIRSAGMPAFGAHLKSDQLGAVAAYLRLLQGQQSNSAALPGNPENGRAIFFNKGHCSECHMVAGKGGFFGRDLSSYASAHSIPDIREAVLNPDANADPHHLLATVVTNDGQRYTGIIRNEDNWSVQLQGRTGEFYLVGKLSITAITREKQSPMPSDYGVQLAPGDIDDLISYLAQVAATQPKQAEEHSEW